MRIPAQVLMAYALLLAIGAVWRLSSLDSAMPDFVALFAAYLGLTARDKIGPSTAGAVILGYLADLLVGAPTGMLALSAGLLCLFCYLIHQRLLVRGRLFTIVFGFSIGLVNGFFVLGLRGYYGIIPDGFTEQLWVMTLSAGLTGVFCPVLFRICRLLDARFARTQRERDIALGGLSP